MRIIFYSMNIYNFFVPVIFQFIYLGQRMALAIKEKLKGWKSGIGWKLYCLQLIYVMGIPIINDDICFGFSWFWLAIHPDKSTWIVLYPYWKNNQNISVLTRMQRPRMLNIFFILLLHWRIICQIIYNFPEKDVSRQWLTFVQSRFPLRFL